MYTRHLAMPMHQPDLQGGAGAVHIEFGPKDVLLVAYEATSFPYWGTTLPLSYRTGHTERRYNTASGFTNWWT